MRDAEAITAIYAPFVTDTAISFETEAPGAAEMRTRIAETNSVFPWLIAETEGQIAGYAYASTHASRAAYRWSANVSIYLDAAHRRQGLGKQLYSALFAVLRRQGYRNLYGGITLPNPASVALHRAMGMSEVGVYRNVGFKLGKWHDVLWLGLSLPDDRVPNGPPIPIDALPPGALAALLRA
jgi:phosphinothricin acetyltransferase